MLNILYDIVLPEPSTLFHVTCDCVTVTLSCDWCVTLWQWCHVNPNPKSLKMKIKEKEITNEKRKNEIVRVYYLELWHFSCVALYSVGTWSILVYISSYHFSFLAISDFSWSVLSFNIVLDILCLLDHDFL